MNIFFRSKWRTALLILLALLLLLSFFFKNSTIFSIYERYCFLPYQQLRSWILNVIPFSVGDILYSLLFLVLLFTIIRLISYLLQWKRKKRQLRDLLLRSVVSLSVVYLLYFYSWGANYARHKIWQPTTDTAWSIDQLAALNDTLISSLNILPDYDHSLGLQETNTLVKHAYENYWGNRVPELKVKPSLFGSSMYYIGIQGYYNPLTGEAQFAKSLPVFMWGFVLAHEMAHQTGVAAEGEANFMAYVMCVKSGHQSLKYSAYFNLLLYANRELSRKDSLMAAQKLDLLRPEVRKDMAELEEMRGKYKSVFKGTALAIYNWMLQSQGQKKGLKSYSDISRLVYLWENAQEPQISLYY
ncbi:MAG: hypothetical protein BGO31_20400 [Bacteroidetes bacterium 43-16]|nr:MAG: hypothetical protein BGO31_20400 [Bacteroidetes bacterium 43-16]